jgi:diaminobutyrate-2-oxoglutarate transaminase
MSVFERLESNVRGYCRSFPATFTRATGATLYDRQGHEYLDFLAGAGTLNYGHNNPQIKRRLIQYLEEDGVLHGLDLHTTAKEHFLETLERTVLWPLELDFKAQFTGPTGTNAVEAALKLARNITGRTNVVSFTNGFHGVSLGSVAATANSHFRDASGVPLDNVTFLPYDGYLGEDIDTLDYFEQLLSDSSSGLDLPAAVLVETVQGEGGVNVASDQWLQRLEALCQEFEILLIVDDIQVGCGRTGAFFSFEQAGIVPDIVTLSKSLSAYGLPMSLVLMKSTLDQWKPGQHNGTFRGNNLAFVSATAAWELYWKERSFSREINRKARLIRDRLETIADEVDDFELIPRGRGMIRALACPECPTLAGLVSAEAYRRGLIIETCGTDDNVLKLLPPLTIEDEQLERGLDIVAESMHAVLNSQAARSKLTTGTN